MAFRLISTSALSLICTTHVLIAQEQPIPPSEDFELDEITVLGTGLETSVFESPASVTVIDGGDITRVAPESVGSFLASVPGIQVEEEGIERIRIRGESARRVLVKVDGQALTDHTDYGQPILVDPLNIERIEVVRGTSSVLSGSRAIGGVINIVTKKGAPNSVAEVTFQGGYFSATDGYRTSASIGGTIERFDYRLTAGQSRLDDRETPDGTLEPSGRDDDSIALHLGYQITPNQYLSFKAQRYDLAADVFTDDPDFSIELPNRDLEKFAFFYEGTDLSPWLRKLSANTYVQTIDRRFQNDFTINTGVPPFVPFAPSQIVTKGESTDDQSTTGVNLAAEMTLFDIGRTFAGVEYENDFLDANRQTTTTTTSNPAPFPPGQPPSVATTFDQREEEARIVTSSAYFQQELLLSDAVTAYLGGRYYQVDAELEESTQRATVKNDDSRFLGNSALVWIPMEDLALRLNIAQGYSYPTLGQLFLETSAAGRQVIGNPDLKPETANTIELGGRWNGPGAVVDATAFYTASKDYVAFANGSNGSLTYENIDNATSYGIELYAEAQIGSSGFAPYVSGSWIQREFEYDTGFDTTDSGTPELFGRVGVKYDWALGGRSGIIDAYVRGESDAKLLDEDQEVVREANAYAVFDIDAEIRLTDAASVTVGLNNLFDESFDPIDQIEGAGRSIDLFLTVTF